MTSSENTNIFGPEDDLDLKSNYTNKHSLNVFTIDIETLPGPVKPTSQELIALAPKTIKKQSTLDAWVENNREIIYRKQALNSMEGQICCISCMINDDEPVSFALGDINIENELDILEKFYDYVSRLSISEWVGFNLRKFDLPWIWRHAIRYRLYELYFEIPKERFDKRVVDIMEEWSTDYNDHNSLNDIAMFLGVGGKTDGVDGSMVYDMYINGEIDKIKSYCEDDVRLTKKIYNVLFNK